MEYGYFSEILSSYGISAVVIAVVVSVICIVLEKVFLSKLKNGIKGYVPFIAGIVITFLYNLIFLGVNSAITEETFYSGLCSGSLGVIIKTAVKKIASGKHVKKSQTSLLIEGIICEYVTENLSVVVTKIEKTVNESAPETLTEKIEGVLSEHVSENISKDEIVNIASILIDAINSLNS